MAENVYDQFAPKGGQGQSGNVYDQFATPSSTPSAPEPPKEDVGFTGAVARGFRRSLPETKSLLYGAGAALADAVGAEGLRDSAINNYRRIQREEVEPLASTATFRRLLSGQDSFGEWAGDVIGNFGGQALQSVAVGAAGAAVGATGGSVAPGVGTAAGGVVGGVGGLVARGAAKKLITESAEKLVADQIKRGVGREAAELAGRQLVQRRLGQVGGAALASYGLNAGQEAGISYTGRVEDAEAAGEELTRGDALRAVGAGAVAGAVDTAAEGIGVGRLLRGASPNPNISRRLLTGAAAGAITEGATEATQGAIERFGAQRDLTSPEAIDDYIENAAAGALGGGVMGGASGVRRQTTLPSGAPVPDRNNGPLSRAVNDAAQTGMLALPPPTITVTPEGDAATGEQELRARREREGRDIELAQRYGSLGLTPDVNAARRAHPGAVPNQPEALAGAAPVAQAPTSQPADPVSPLVQNLRRQQPVPWIDATTGESRVPTDEEVTSEIRRFLDAQAAAGLKRTVKNGEVINALGLNSIGRSMVDRDTLIGEARKAQKQGLDAPTATVPSNETAGTPADESKRVPGSDAARLRRMVDRKGTPYYVPVGEGAAAPVAQPPEAVPGVDDSTVQELERDRDELDAATATATATRAPSATIAGPAATTARTATPSAQPAGSSSAEPAQGEAPATTQSLPPVDAVADPARPQGQPASAGSAVDTGSLPSAQGTPASSAVEDATARDDSDIDVEETRRGLEVDRADRDALREALAKGVSPVDGKPIASAGFRQQYETELANLELSVAEAERFLRDRGVEPQATSPLQVAANDAATSPTNDRAEPTEAQKEAGNYKKGHARIAGLDISIENPAGTSRRPEWPALANHYGYFKGTVGRDKDHVDVFLTDNAEDASRPVFVVDQIDPKTGKFDEHKVIMGAASEAEARATYQANYSADWQGLGGIKQMSLEQFRTWVKDPKKTNRRVTRAPAPAAPAAPPVASGTAPVASEAPAVASGAPVVASGAAPTVPGAPAPMTLKDRQARAEAVFSKNRAAITEKGLRKGDTVTWTQQGRTYTGEILSLGDKEQAVIAVGVRGERGVADYHVGAAIVSKVDGAAVKDSLTAAAPATGKEGLQVPTRKAAPTASKSAEPVVRVRGGKPAYVPAARGTLEAYFQPGRVVNAYGGKDRVISFNWNDDQSWSVRVIRVDADGNTVPGERERSHSTMPTTRELHAVLGEPRKAEPKAAPKAAPARAAAVDAAPAVIGDLGEKIGGARKDTAVSRGSQPKARAADAGDDVAGWRKRYIAMESARRPGQWILGKKGSSRLVTTAGGPFASQAEAEAAIPLAEVARNHRAVPRDKGWAIARDVTDRKRLVLKDGFATREDALRYMAEHAVELIETKTSIGEEALPRPERVFRIGDARRDSDVAGQQFIDTFGFRGVEFGNWNNQAERQEVMNHAYDGLLDLADLLNLPPRALSLNGELGLAFGARGHGLSGARAHYERDYAVMNLTKMKGAGSLAHEWMHAVDHYFGRQDGKASSKRVENNRGDTVFDVRDRSDDYLSHGASFKSGMRAELLDSYKALVNTMLRRGEQYVEDTARAEQFLGKARNDLQTTLQAGRTHIASERAYGSRKRAATPEELATWDALSDKLLNGEAFALTPVQRKQGGGMRMSNDTLEGLDAVMKAVTNRSGFNAERAGLLDRVRWGLTAYHQRIELWQQADKGETKTRQVPTNFLTEAKKLDQGRATDYWTSPHEMLARAFSAYVEDKLEARGAASAFLSFGSDERFALDVGQEVARPFPGGDERRAINGAFDKFFQTVETRDSDRGVALFSKADDTVAPVRAERAAGDPEALWRDADQFYRKQLQGHQFEGPDGVVRFAGEGRKKALATGRRDALRMGVARQLGELAKVARVYGEAPDRAGDRGITYAYAVAPVEVDGVTYAVRMLYRQTREQPGSRGFYTFEGFEMGEPGAMDRGRRSGDQLDRRGSPGSEYTVAQLEAALNNPRAFSRTAAAPAGRGLPLARAQVLKAELTAKWGENAPNVVLVTSAEGFPDSAKVDPDYRRGEGFYDGRPTVWLNLGRIRTEARFAEVLAHEVIGHYGVERVVGRDEWAGIVDAIERMDREGTGSGQVRRVLAEVHQKQPGLSRENYAREVIAFMAEKGLRNSWVNRVVAAVRRFMRRIMPTVRWRESDIRQLLGDADGFLRRGRATAARAQLVQSYAFSADGVPQATEVEELALDQAFVAGLSPVERRSGPMTSLASALWAELGTASPFFRDWFGDSKVVDKAGQPLKVYHGTAADFEAFDPTRAGKSTNHTTAHLGIFFDANRSKAEHYARVASNDVPADQRLIEVYLDIRNPYVMSQDEFTSVEGREESLALRQRLERAGYDGIQLPTEGQWIVFQPGQIKDSGNRGTFDRGDARMLFSKAAADPSAVLDDIEAVMDATRGDAKVVDRARAALNAMSPKALTDLVARTKDSTRPGWLYFLTTRHLTELGADYFGNMRLYSDYLAQMGADRNQLAAEGEGVAESARKWAGKNRAESQALFRLMHDATIQGVDPAEAYQSLQFRYGGQLRDATRANVKEALTAIQEQMRGRGGDNKTDLLNEARQLRAMPAREQQRKRNYPALVDRWNQLSPEAQAHYRAMRDLYQKRSGQVEEALVARINDADVPENHKRKIITTIRMQFEAARLQGVYFPLQRFGHYYVAAERDGTSSFLMFERHDQLNKAVKDLRARGFTIKKQGLKSEGKAVDAPSGTFVADVIQTLDKAGVSDKTQDEIYQLYLQALPELSMRKHSIHRQSVPGFDPDAVRAFAYNMHHGAHQLAKLRFAHKLEDVIDVLKKAQDGLSRESDADTRRVVAGDAILSELDRRHQWITNPQDSQATNLISSFGFVYYLGLTPAAALVNLTQTALVSYPYLAARFGGVKAMNYLLAAGRQSGGSVGQIQKKLTDPDELRAHQVLQSMGALDKTQAHNLAGIAEGGMQGYNPKWARAMEIIGWGFHKTEVINRETTGIAAYRLARAEGKGFDEAVRIAADAINDTHFDYTNANRARFMQSGTAKVLLMFRQYSLNMTWHLGRMVWNATKGESPEVRKLARRNLTGVLGMSALFSGALGLPLASVVMGVLNSVASSFGDDDEPWDAETEFRAFLAGMLGDTAAETLLGGAVNQVTGADIGSRVSLSQLWFRDADRELEGRGAYYNLLEQAAGPMGGVLKNALVGKQLMDDGHLMRGVETVLPKAMKDVLKAGRYAAEGANNLRGDALVQDLNVWQTLLQLNGFTPSELAQRYDRNRSLKGYEQQILDRRQQLVDAFAMAHRLGDDDGRSDTVAAIAAFNRANPEIAITPASIRRSLLARARYSAQAEGGIMLNQKLAPRLREAVGGDGGE